MQPNPTLEALAREAAEELKAKLVWWMSHAMTPVNVDDFKNDHNDNYLKAFEHRFRHTITRATYPLEQKILTLNQLNIDACAFEDELIKKLNVPARADDQDDIDSARILKAVEGLQADCVVMREALKDALPPLSNSCSTNPLNIKFFSEHPELTRKALSSIEQALSTPNPGQHLLDELLRLRVTANERDSLLVENATLREQLTEALKEVSTADTAIWTKMFRKP